MSSSSLFLLLFIMTTLLFQPTPRPVCGFSRVDFPSDFVFGAGTSAFQVEGAAFEDGRTPSIMDAYITGGADNYKWRRACDQYHRYKEDVKLMVDTRLDAYKFSISWSRLIPYGKGQVNPKAVEYYNNLINELIKNGIQAHVLLLHLDMPQTLEDEYGGWISPKIVKDFTTYADVCFREFGDRVSYWTTMNEPNIVAKDGYDTGVLPPQRCSPPFGSCTRGNSTTEPYIAAHNMLLAHASTVSLYREKYQGKQHGYIGLNLFTSLVVPKTKSKEDLLAVERSNKFFVGWFLDPLMFGDYPDIMKKNVGSRLPSFTKYESKALKSSLDFISINCYGSMIVEDNPSSLLMYPRDWIADSATKISYGKEDGEVLEQVLEFYKQNYGNASIYIYENGYRMHRGLLNDTSRIKYLSSSIGSILNVVRNGSNVKGYFVWSFLDMIELIESDTWAFGLYDVNLDDPNLKRIPKLSAHWFSSFLNGRNVATYTNILEIGNSTIVSDIHEK